MYEIIIGTTPTIKYVFDSVDPRDFVKAILTVKDKDGETIFEKTLETATVGETYLFWTLSQEDTLTIGKRSVKTMLNWLTDTGIRGASKEETLRGKPNHIEEVISDG